MLLYLSLLFVAVIPLAQSHCHYTSHRRCRAACSYRCPRIDMERCLRLCHARCDRFCGNLRYSIQKLSTQENNQVWQSCGKEVDNNFKIWNGLEASLGQFPWAVKITREEHACGGALISKRHVITSAHCFHNKEGHDEDDHEPPIPLEEFKVYIGGVDATSSNGVTGEIRTGRKHRGYTRRNDRGITDVYIFELKNPVSERYAAPICLVDDSYKIRDSDKTVVTYGWGITDRSYNPSNKLRYVSLTTKDCQGDERVSDCICTEGDHTNVPCRGDSGGGLQIETTIDGEQRWTLLGVLSKAKYKNCPSSDAKPKLQFNGIQDILGWICDMSGVCKK